MKDEEVQITVFDSAADSRLYEHRQSIDKLREELSKFGLTANQCKVYIYLGKYGSKTAPEVCKTLKLELWDSIPEFNTITHQKENKFQMLQGTNQIHSKIKEMISNTKQEFLVLGSEKDFLKFYHSDFFEPLDKSKVELKLLTGTSAKSTYIFDEINRTKVKKMPENIQDNLCFIIKDDEEIVFFIRNSSQSSQEISAIWTDSESMIYSMKMLFQSIWAKSKNIHL